MTAHPRYNHQSAAYPLALHALVGDVTYRPGWRFKIDREDRGQGSVGLTLTITVTTVNSYNHDEVKRIAHLFPVPPAAYDVRSWQRWLFDRIRDVETHEAMEFFTVDGIKPYAPSHGPGNDPYLIREVGTEQDVRTSFRGELNPALTESAAYLERVAGPSPLTGPGA